MKKFSFNEKTIIVTGASQGIGYEICKYLLENSTSKIIGISRTKSNLDDATSKFNTPRFIPLLLDVSKKESWLSLVDFINSNGYVVNGIINCAGILPKFNKFDDDCNSTFKVFEVNFNSIVYSASFILPIIKLNGDGVMINVSSSSALCPFIGISAYSSSKSAVQRFSECLSFENKNVKVVTVMPGFTKTSIMRSQTGTDKELSIIDKVSKPANKVAKKIIKKASKGKRRVITGFDAHCMNFLYKFFPVKGPKLIGYILKKSNFKLFENITK